MSATLLTEKATLRRVHDGLFHVRKGLAPFVEARMRKLRGQTWLHYASRASGSGPSDPLDAYGLLKTMLDNWRDGFEESFRPQDKQKAATTPRWRWRRATPPRTSRCRSPTTRRCATWT